MSKINHRRLVKVLERMAEALERTNCSCTYYLTSNLKSEIKSILSDTSCPDCFEKMENHYVGNYPVFGCGKCDGLAS